jgi:hypothetical protein
MKKSASLISKKIPATKLTSKVVKKMPAKKAVTKKVTPKKAIKKVISPKKGTSTTKTTLLPLVSASEHQKFWVNDGQILADLMALADSFRKMDTLLFQYHVNSEKNDFADWVEHVLRDISCAQSLRKVQTPEDAYVVVSKRLRFYSL